MRALVVWIAVAFSFPLSIGSAFAADGASTPQPAASPGPGLSGGSNPEDLRMKALEAEVDVLKEKVFNSKARLLQLQEITLHGAAAGAVARLRFRNEMGGAYKLESATWVLDGQTIFQAESGPGTGAAPAATGAKIKPLATTSLLQPPESVSAKNDRGALAGRNDLELFDGAIVPGSHNVTVTLVYRGAGYQVFTYLEGYHFTVQSSYAFLVEEGKTTELIVTATPKPELTHSYEERLDLKFALSSSESILPAAHTEGATP